MNPGDKVYFASDPNKGILTVKTVSPHVDMVELEEFEDGWIWISGLVLVSEAAPAPEPDALDSQLKFLGF
jgi:hypothetical protein